MVIGVIGLGLMGGSLSKAFKKYIKDVKILGTDLNKQHEKIALELSLVDEIVEFDDILSCDVVILALPVDGIIKLMPKFENISETTTIIDLGGTKELIINSIPNKIRKNFVAGHPMCGTEKFGPTAAIDELYEGKNMVFCNLEQNDISHKNKAIKLFESIKMKLVYMDAKTHDIHTCYMSHLPHLISFSLANTVMQNENPLSIVELAAGGFKDMSRIAKSSPDMWTSIFKQNKQNLLESVEIFEKNITSVKQMLQDDNYDDLKQWMLKANSLHNIL